MKKVILALVISVVVCMQIQAQKEANNWAFGQNVGLTWNTTQSLTATGLAGTANAVLDGLPTFTRTSIVTQEGCFSLSDSDGNLLFYSDGMTIWDKNNAVMTNGTGLTGHNSSAQSGIILPYPNSPNKYMAVSIGIDWTNKLSYTAIDMSQAGGLGAVIASEKHILLSGGMGGIGESVTSIRHANGTDYWIVAPGRGATSYFNAWLATSTGVIATPIVTTSPASINHSSACGYIKFTADGKHFAWGGNNAEFIYGDFDNSTGVFSNIKKVSGLKNTYGLEFSPSMKYLYIGGTAVLYVFDFEALLAASNPSTVTYKTYNLGIDRNTPQLAPDGRIYFCAYQKSYLYVIDNPDEYNNLKIYQLPNSFLGTGLCRIGLPSFAASWFSAKATEKSFVCTGNDFRYTVEINMVGPSADLPTRLEWDFGDGSAKVNQSIVSGNTIYKQTHNYTSTGKYSISITPYRADGVALSKTTIPANVIDCVFKTNRMIRIDLQNTATKEANR